MTKIRQSPSGPDITNDAGGKLNVGGGTPSRSWRTHLTAVSNIPSGSQEEIRSDMSTPASATDFRVTVPDPDPGNQYIARLRFDLRMLATYAGDEVTTSFLQALAGASVETFLGLTNVILSNPGVQMPSHVDFESQPFYPTALAGWVEGQPFTVRSFLGSFVVAPADSIQLYSAGSIGTALLEVTEYF